MTIPRREAVRRLRSKLPKIHRRREAHSTDFRRPAPQSYHHRVLTVEADRGLGSSNRQFPDSLAGGSGGKVLVADGLPVRCGCDAPAEGAAACLGGLPFGDAARRRRRTLPPRRRGRWRKRQPHLPPVPNTSVPRLAPNAIRPNIRLGGGRTINAPCKCPRRPRWRGILPARSFDRATSERSSPKLTAVTSSAPRGRMAKWPALRCVTPSAQSPCSSIFCLCRAGACRRSAWLGTPPRGIGSTCTRGSASARMIPCIGRGWATTGTSCARTATPPPR